MDDPRDSARENIGKDKADKGSRDTAPGRKVATYRQSGGLGTYIALQALLFLGTVALVSSPQGSTATGFAFANLMTGLNPVFFCLWLVVCIAVFAWVPRAESVCLVIALLPMSTYCQLGGMDLFIDLPVQLLLPLVLLRCSWEALRKQRRIAVLSFMYLGLVFLSAAASDSPALSIRNFIRYGIYVAAGIVMGQVISESSAISKNVVVLFFTGGVEISILVIFNAFFRFAGMNDLGVSFAMPFFQDRGSGSAYIVFACCAGISLFVRYKASRWWVLPGLFIMLAAVGLAGARAAYLGIAAVLLLVLIRAGKNMLLLAAALGVIALAAVAVLNSMGSDLNSSFISSWLVRFQSTLGYFDTESEFAINERFHLWSTALNMTINNPLLGVGYDQFRYRLPEFASPDGNLGVHHEFLKVLTESGIVAFLTYLYMILGGIYNGVRKCFRIPRSFAAQDWAALACLAYAIQGCFNNFQQVAKVTVPFMMAISALWRLPRGSAEPTYYPLPDRTVAVEP